MIALWLLLVAWAAPAPQVALMTSVSLRSPRAQVQRRLEALGATVQLLHYNDPGGMSAGLLAAPSLLAQLNRYQVRHPFFDKLPRSGPSFLRASLDGAYASYGFVAGRLWAMAEVIPAGRLEPLPDPFDSGRLTVYQQTRRALCRRLRASERDPYGNPIAFKGSCLKGTVLVRYQPTRPDATLQILVTR